MTHIQPAPRTMTLDEFLPLVGDLFEVDCSPATVRLTLVEATPLSDAGSADRPPFSLVFRSAPNAMLTSGIYTMKSGRFGPDTVHIAPILARRDAAPGYYYQAIFN